MTIQNTRRQRYLDESSFSDNSEILGVGITLALENLARKNLIPSAPSSLCWQAASNTLQIVLLDYTAGRPISDLRAQMPALIERFDTYLAQEKSPRSEDPPRNVADTLEITQIDAYVYVLWLLALCKLLKHEEFASKVMNWVDKTFQYNRGRDKLFENVVQALTGKHVGGANRLFHENPYKPLAEATDALPEDRAALVKQFVTSWYKGMKNTYWHGAHTGGIYFGYWCLEAALVTILFDIDDSSYRDHLVYPKDLVDWYRANTEPSHKNAAPFRAPLRAEPGQPCPRSGEWFSPFLKKTVHVNKGEPMPGPDKDKTGNSVIWYLRDE
ncbi:PoNe immunity protein domain-containing protein [Caballeronia sp. LZ016]|uniref:PoNe immunity protein domain-containing protein n=1 Tax=Caballeronia sp. LZ016 TaxID=3038554 RepID=UPI0028571811|nr:PoNe immunity protein domain-containing protein [Caballeronia sp. LZ016]MDR5740387.1 DUF1911 domain-containing protein [Caballeronia sp. LZ016]